MQERRGSRAENACPLRRRQRGVAGPFGTAACRHLPPPRLSEQPRPWLRGVNKQRALGGRLDGLKIVRGVDDPVGLSDIASFRHDQTSLVEP